MGDNVWNGLLEKWNMPLHRQKCKTTKKNQTSEKDGCLHTEGSISVYDHAIRLSPRPCGGGKIEKRCWLEAASGKYKRHVYDIGNVGSQDDCINSYIQQTQTSSSTQQQNSQEIFNLRSQLQHHNQRLQNFEGFIGTIVQYLPPSAAAAAQEFFNLQILKFKIRHPMMSNQNNNL
ncbi:hypothetical protein LR48_Vigan10g027300 [Vigna angularis]|uniref:Uncharacterized protein n=1 Tax=Phaseolus angularis TaxID=3914 RepID=A0A0L9VH56_PHAAN|nr:hypothetical protein LR48_Vigan10g027300 [Vigna angularis]